MGRSVSLSPQPAATTFYHRLSNRHYRIDGPSMRRHQVDAQGRQINVVEKSIDVAIGSGNRAVTYAHRAPGGRLIELPVSFYAIDGWAMSPGYDKADHLDFRRPVADACLFCHSGGRDPAPIGCGRCHGDGAAHAARPSRANIVNPARLTPQRQLEVCLQCHLETASRGFPDSVRVPGRDVFSFRPGEPLAAYKAYFDRDDNKDRFEVNHAGYRLLLSRCFTASPAGALTCITCHDPHTARARNACAGCHAGAHAAAPEKSDCAGCHMPKRRTDDAIHVRMTDHRIARPAPRAEPVREDHAPYSGGLRPFYTGHLLELAQVRQQIESGRGDEAAYRRWRKIEPSSPAALAALGDALLRWGERDEAVPLLERARKADPGHAGVLNALAVDKATAGRLKEALQLLEQARAADPDHPLTWINLGVTHEALGDAARAEACYREAIRHQPDSSEARRRLATLRSGAAGPAR